MSSDEWEYEYSAHETENLYFTLDLTTHVPDALGQVNAPGSERVSRNLSAPRADPADNPNNADQDDEDSEDDEDLPELQVLDLETSNPLIKFEQSVYSCYWTTDLGTQFHIAQAGQTSDPLRKGTVLDVLGISRARLIGKPIQLIDRNAPIPGAAPAKAKAPSPIPVEDEEEEAFVTTTGPLQIPKSILKTSTSKSQASFLTRLSEIKLRKGEKDQVPVIAVKSYTAPDNADAIKRKAEDDDRNSALVMIDGRKKRRRRRPMGVKPRNGNPGRKGRDATARALGIERDEDEEEIEESIPAGMFVRGEMERDAASSPMHINRNGSMEWRASGQESEQYLTRQNRAEYIESVRRESSPEEESALQPERPPWLARVDSEQGD